MSLIWTANGTYQRVDFEREAELESAILEVQKYLFGRKRIYLDVKKKIGLKGSTQNVPDGYLIDLSGQKPRLFVVENELASHDPLRHIAVQILQFSLSFEEHPHKVKSILVEALKAQPEAQMTCEKYANAKGFRNLDHLLEHLVHEVPFAALVIIDEASDDLQNVLARKFNFPVEVLELAAFRSQAGDVFYYFEPFLEGISEEVETEKSQLKQQAPDISQIDTVVVPAREEGFERVFLGEDRWYAIRLHASMRPQIKYIASYQVAPISAITHVAPVRSIELWKDTGYYVVNFSEKAKEISPIKLVKGGRVRPLQNLRYTTKTILDSAKTLDDVW
jgi:hypothetical protein